uniref:Reverse transcriptase domain-containing protein n=1 Tax=Tanacetum cinerariifolium TaxID=118510 RepID=A0A6L2M7U3_TANCI|nr:reverse transcriptase domain-containing protein [Tanacetum cinerariifolium]
MSTRSSARNLFSPLDNPELTIRRRSRTDPTLLNDFEMAAEGTGDLPVPDLRTMKELCQPSLNGRGGPIAPISIQAKKFRLKNDMIQQVQNSCQFHGLPGDDANKHLDKFLHVTQGIKVNGVTDHALRLYLFPHSLTHRATAWFDRLPRTTINTFEQMAKMFLGKYFPPSMETKLRNEITNFRGTFIKRRPEDFYDLIENMTSHHNDWDTSAQRSESSSSITSSSDTEIAALKAEMAKINKNLMRVIQVNQQVKAVTPNCETYGGPHSYSDCPTTVGQTQNVYVAGAYQGTLPGNTITNPKEVLKGIITRSGTAYQGPTIPTTSSSIPLVVERETETTKDMVHPTNNRSTKDVQPLAVQTESLILNSEPVAALVSAPRPNQRLSIPYPSRLHDQKLCDKANDQKEKFFQIFKDLNFIIRFADALILMPKFFPTFKTLLTNKDKLSKLARTPLNEHCSVVLLQKFQEKLGDAGKFLIPCDFLGMAECLALADLGASINLMKLLVWSKLSLPDLSPMCITLELVDRLISREMTLRVGKEAITFNLDQTLRYSANYNDMTANRIDVIDMACEEYSQEVLGFFDVIASGNPTPYYDPIVSTSSPTLTPFEESDFLLEEVNAFLALEDDPTSPEVDHTYVELKDLPPHLKYAFLEGDDKFAVIIAKYLSVEEKTALITVLKSHKRAIAWKLSDIKGIDPEFCTYKIIMKDDFEPAVQHQRRVNPKIHDVIKNEVLKLLDAGLIYPISDSPWVSLVHCIPKKGGFTVVENEENELIPTRLVTGWRVCIDYQKLNEATRKDHFPLLFMDQMLERLARNEYYCFLDGFSCYFQIPIVLKDQKRPHSLVHTERLPTVACLLGYAMHQECFRVFGNSFQTCLSHLEKMLKRCEDTNLFLNWEKSHFMVKEGIVLGHKISKNRIEVDKAKVDVIAKLPHPTTFKGIRSFLDHAGFYQRFIKDCSKIARPMTRLFEKDTPFFLSKECVEAFPTLKRKLSEASILIAPDWDLPFELMCYASDFAIDAVLGQRQEKHFRPIHYASKTITEA